MTYKRVCSLNIRQVKRFKRNGKCIQNDRSIQNKDSINEASPEPSKLELSLHSNHFSEAISHLVNPKFYTRPLLAVLSD